MEVISISDTTDESVISNSRNGPYFSQKRRKTSTYLRGNIFVDEDEVITLSSDGDSEDSSQTERCRVTWNKERRLEGPRVSAEDLDTPSPRKKVKSWMLNQQLYLLKDGKKFPFSEQHLDSLAVNAFKLCSPQWKTDKSSILVRQDYLKTSNGNSSTSFHNNSFISSSTTSLVEIDSSTNNCDTLRDLDDCESDSGCSSNRTKKNSSVSKISKKRRSSNLSVESLSKSSPISVINQPSSVFEAKKNINIDLKTLKNKDLPNHGFKRSRSSSKSSSEVKLVSEHLPQEKYIKNNTQAALTSNDISFINEQTGENVTESTILNKMHRYKSKSLDVPLSPETQKKNELCSYLQLMNTSIPKNQQTLQNRRSTRVKNHQKLMEKRKIEQMLNFKDTDEEKLEKTDTATENIEQSVICPKNIMEMSCKTPILQNRNFGNHLAYKNNCDNSVRSLTRKSFADLKMEAFTPSWKLHQNNLMKSTQSADLSLRLDISNEELNFDEIMQDFIKKENINCFLKENQSTTSSMVRDFSINQQNKSDVLERNIKSKNKAKNSTKSTLTKRKESKVLSQQFKKNKEAMILLNMLKKKNHSKSKEKIYKQLGKYWINLKLKTPDKTLQKRRCLRNRTMLKNKKKGSENTSNRNTKKINNNKTKVQNKRLIFKKENKPKHLRNRVSEPLQIKKLPTEQTVKIEDKENKVSLHMDRIDYKNENPTNAETQSDCKDLTLNKRFPIAKNNMEKRDNPHILKISPMLHEKLKSQFELLKNLTPEHRKALFESMRFINWNIRNGQSISPKTDTTKVLNNCDILKSSVTQLKTEEKDTTNESEEYFYGFEPSDVKFSQETSIILKETLKMYEDILEDLKNKCVIAKTTTIPFVPLQKEDNSSAKEDSLSKTNLAENKTENSGSTVSTPSKSRKDDVIISIPDSNTPDHENFRTQTTVLPEPNIEPETIHQNEESGSVPTSTSPNISGTCKNVFSKHTMVPLSSDIAVGHTSVIISHTNNISNSAILSPILSYVTLPPNVQNGPKLFTVNSTELVKNTTILPPNCSYVNANSNNPNKSLNCYLNRTKRSKITIDAGLQTCESNEDEDMVVGSKTQNRLEAVQPVYLSHDEGRVEQAFYFDFMLVVVQQTLISFWKVCPLGNILGAHDMWEAKGNVCKVMLDGCVDKTSKETVMYLEKSVAYAELWAKENANTSNVNVYVVIYFWMECFSRPDKKLVQLESVQCPSADIHYVILKRSRKIIVTWFAAVNGIATTFVHCYHLASDYQSIAGTKQMGLVNYYVSSVHNIQDCDTLIMGCGEQKITLWNVEYGFVVATIDLIGLIENPQTLWSKCDRGFLFVLQQFSDGVLKLIAINGINYTWKQLRSFEPSSSSGSLQGVCMENGILVAFYDNITICWKVENKEVILELPSDENVKLFISDKSVVSISTDRIQVRNALQYLLTCDDIYNTQL